MGEVYKARDTRLDRTVAIKILPSTDAGLKARFEREARTIALLQHPHICTLHDVGRTGDTEYLVMEYLEGRTLRKVLAERPLPAKVIIRYAIQLCQGLAAAHDRGIVHRDLKPENVFVTNAGQIKILDFGVAKLLQDSAIAERGRDTGPGMLIGTVAYMSPEQIKGERVDSRSDVFSLGIVLYEMVAGNHPFRGENYVETMHAILNSKRTVRSMSDDPVLNILSQIIERCLEKDRGQRFQNAREIFAIRGAQLVLATPAAEGEDETTGQIAEPSNRSVTYRDPPDWLVWSGPLLILLVLIGVPLAIWLPPRYGLHLTGCLTSKNAVDFILLMQDQNGYSHQYLIQAPRSVDLRPHVGHLVDVRYTYRDPNPGAGDIFIRDIRTIGLTCK
jgi:serine/threonine protein kinase